jgi:excisionase family DNA binding protein
MQLALDPSDIEAIASRVANLIAQEDISPWLNTSGAAEYLCCPVSRIRKLTMTDSIPSYREGGRRLYKRSELDAFIAAGGASTK